MLYWAMYWPARAPGPGHLELHLGRDALREAVGQPGLRPLPPRPVGPLGEALLEGGEGEVEQDHEGQLVVEEVVGDVRGGAVAGEDLVEGQDGPEVEVGLPAESEGDLVHVAVELLEEALEALEHRVEGLLVAGEVAAHEGLEDLPVAVRLAPEARHLLEPAPGAGPLRLAVALDQLGLQRLPRRARPRGQRRAQAPRPRRRASRFPSSPADPARMTLAPRHMNASFGPHDNPDGG